MADRNMELTYPGKASRADVVTGATPAVLEKVRSFGNRRAQAGVAGVAGGGDAWANRLIFGDNLGVLASLIEEKAAGGLCSADGTPGVRLVYIDPPFSTNLRFRGRASQQAYDDRLTGAEFVEFLRHRLVLISELLAPGGSVFVHIDWKMSHYARVIMDEVFGPESFLNEIVWSYGGRGAKAVSGQFSRNHDTLLWYARAPHTFNRIYTERRVPKGTGSFRQDAEGRWFKTAPRGDYTDASIKALEAEGRIYRTRTGKVRIKYFVGERGGDLIEEVPVGDVWTDIADAMHMPVNERTGYPTQKPLALAERIIRAATNPGDLVCDAFSGSGTTLVAAEGLGRRWVGIDSGRLAVSTAEKRLLAGTAGSGGLLDGRAGGVCPFDVYTAEGLGVADGSGKDGLRGLDCALEPSSDGQGPAVVISGPGADSLSSVMVDLDYGGDTFNIDLFRDAAGLSLRGRERHLPIGARPRQPGARCAVTLVDIHGREALYIHPRPGP